MALQLPDGVRLHDSLSAQTSLFQMLQHFERSGAVMGAAPLGGAEASASAFASAASASAASSAEAVSVYAAMPRNFTARRGRPSADEQSGPIKIEYFVDGDMRPQLTVMNRTVRIVRY